MIDYEKLMLEVRLDALEMYLCENENFKNKYIKHFKIVTDLIKVSGNSPEQVGAVLEKFETHLKKISSYQNL